MKIDAANSNTSLKTKLEKIFRTENDEMFRDILDNGLVSIQTTAFDFDNLSDFVSATKNDLADLKSSYKYDCLTMDRDDAMFFANAVKGENYGFTVNGEVLMLNTDVQSVEKTYKSAAVSKTLADMLANSQQTNKPVRIDFGNDISAVLRVSSDGKISAEFIPSDKIAEEYLRNNISYLEQVFEKEDIPYNELTYRQQNKRQRQNSNSDGSNERRGS